MSITWVVVAESSRAKIYEMDSPQAPLRDIREFTHPDSRKHEHDLTSDLPGRAFDSMGRNRHAMEANMSAKQHEALLFAQQLSHYLESSRLDKEFDDLIIVSAPAFLGLLRKNLTDATSRRVIQEIDKNLVQHDAAEIRAHLPERITAP